MFLDGHEIVGCWRDYNPAEYLEMCEVYANNKSAFTVEFK